MIKTHHRQPRHHYQTKNKRFLGVSTLNYAELYAHKATKVRFVNNIAVSSATSRINSVKDPKDDVTYDYNLFWGPNPPLDKGSNDIVADPLFIEASKGNLGLQPLSPAIDKAGPSLPIMTDLGGGSRPVGARADLGAYEFRAVVRP
jgi:hypothetical protein